MSSGDPTPMSSPEVRATVHRKRGATGGHERSATRQRTREPSPNDNGDDQEERQVDLSVYNPDQTLEERRQLQSKLRDWQRSMRENPDEFVGEDTRLLEFLHESTRTLDSVKQTGEAAIDARGLVAAADLSAKRVQRLLTGGAANGIDVDEFASKVITFMLQGGGIDDDNAPELSSTQRFRRQGPSSRRQDDEDEDEDAGDDNGDMFNWAHCGRYVSIPHVRRPALTGFLLGPLSVERKARKAVTRSAPLRIDSLREVRPEILNVEKLKRDKEDDLVTMARQIHKSLERIQLEAQDAVENTLSALDHEPTEEESEALMEEHALRSTGGIDLMKFVINPHSFGQTVENIFYVSFLIREGTAKLEYDEHGLPSLAPVEVEKDPNVRPDKSIKRNQAFMSIDMDTWQDIVKVFKIQEALIPHREETVRQTIGAGQWYS